MNDFVEVENDWQKNEEKSKRFIRLLILKLKVEDIYFSERKCSLLLDSSGSEHFATLIVRPLYFYTQLFFDDTPVVCTGNPLWISLISKGKSFRKFSSETFFYCKALFSLIDLNVNDLLERIDDPGKYALGAYDLIKSSNFSDKLKILRKETISRDKVNEWIDTQHFSLVSFLFVRDKTYQTPDIINHLALAVELEQSTVTKITIYNALSFYYLKSKNSIALFDNLEKVSCVIEKIKDEEIRSQLRGNYFLHKSEFELEFGCEDKAILYLKEALLHDTKYFDTYYRLAMIFHDRMDSVCLYYYEKSLEYSPLAFQVLNDYIIALEEFGMVEDKTNVLKVLEQLDFKEGVYDEIL